MHKSLNGDITVRKSYSRSSPRRSYYRQYINLNIIYESHNDLRKLKPFEREGI